MKTAIFGTRHHRRRPAERRPGRSEAGYTLLELLIVLAITAFALGIAIPSLSAGRSQAELHRAESSLLAYLRDARMEAITANRDLLIRVDLQARTITSEQLGARKFGDGDLEIEFTTARLLIVDPMRADIVFFADGSSSGGSFVLRLGQGARIINVDWITGLARPRDG